MFVAYYRSGRLSQHLLWLACAAGVVGLLASRALVSLAPVAGVVAGLANPELGRIWPRYFRNAAAMRAAALVVFLLLSGLYTSEWATWRHELFRSLSWLGVPLAFTLAVPLTGRQRRSVGSLFVLGTAAIGVVTLGKYLLHPAEANEAIRIGQNVQAVTRIFHVPFGVMLALSFFWGLLLQRQAPAVLRAALLVAAAGAALTLHVLAYRTGLLVFYVGLLAYALWMLVRRHLVLGIGLFLLLALGPWLAYRTLPSVRQRVASTLFDVYQYSEGRDINNYSLARRLAAVETASAVIQKNWLLGVGPADTHAAMMEQYSWKDFGLRPANRVEVHNQYLEALMGGGIVGLGLWLAVLVGPLVAARTRRNPYVWFFVLIQATVMMTADMLSLQLGLNLFVFSYGFLVVAAQAAPPSELVPERKESNPLLS
ncbi:O-antigen ligase family protein [Hymenobacter metallicola]|uniref:O-antigen ligase domain-containing protein n=1 Tax=Hymenobacter metallicola TaxID=2563114 RepID=A0A4Z0QIM7_9BACT|nr:O-antigen ligase family protein [Hymenobacter metallicola]TGE29346.1 O-antigen ligase domain-containing protein [Hymenobacter metallicola]